MKIKHFITIALFAYSIFSFAQNNAKEVLFKIDDKPYFTDEFLRVYNKNIDLVKDESQKNLNHYLELYIAYKLKLQKAYKLGLQNEPQFKSEFNSYKTQLAKNFTLETKVTNSLMEESYGRLKKEINASHLLIACDENASPQDTLMAYNKINTIRDQIINGSSFESMVLQYSQDPSAKENKGNLGYFTAFRMVYPFETAAYSTPEGSISKPVRTKFGYHLVKVLKVRENLGEILVAHIMILKSKNASEVENQKAINTINDIYAKIKQGEDFSTLAQHLSEDKSTAPRGGVLPKFSTGQLSSQIFENKAFELNKIGDYTTPFESEFGWHIVKLIDKYPVKKYEEMQRELDAKIRKDERSKIIASALNTKLRQKYKVIRNQEAYKHIQEKVNDTFYDPQWKPSDELNNSNSTLFTIENKTISLPVFIAELNNEHKLKATIKPISKLLDKVYNTVLDNQLNIYYNENLENEYPEYANIVQEYRDGLLLFDIMEKEIWTKAKQDTLGLKKYYQENKLQYQWKDRVKVIFFSSIDENIAKKAQKLLKQNFTANQIKEQLNTKDHVNIILKEEILEEGTNNNIAIKERVSKVYKENNYFCVNKVIEVQPARLKKFEETKGKVISDYQQFLEDNWVNTLKKEYVISVNNDVFDKIKTSIQK